MSENSKITDSAYSAENSVNETIDPCQACDVESKVAVAEDTDKTVLDVMQNIIVVKEAPSIKEKLKFLLSRRFINRLVVVGLAIILFVLSFAPLMRCEVTLDGSTQVVRLSGVDAIKITGMLPLSKEFNKADITYGIELALPEEFQELVVSRAAYSRVGVTASTVIAAMAYVFYAIMTIVLMITAASNLTKEILGATKKKEEMENHASDRLLPFLLCIFPAVYFCLTRAFTLYLSNVFSLNDEFCLVDAKMAWGMFASLIVLVAGSVFTCASRSLENLHANVSYFDRERVKHIICIGLVLLILVFSFIPCVKINIWDPDYEKETSVGVSVWEMREMTKKERNIYKQITPKINLDYIDGVVQEDDAGETLMHSILLSSKVSTIRAIYVVMQIVFLVVLLLIGFLLWSLMGRAFFGVGRLRTVNFWKVMTMIGALAWLATVITLQVLLGSCLPSSMKPYVEFSLGDGMIMSFACVLFAVILKLKKKIRAARVEEEYDNADISYAPYVLYIKD